MSSGATPFFAAKPLVATGFAAVFRGALRRITWKIVAATIAIVAGLEVWSVFDNTLNSSATAQTAEANLSSIVINLAMAFAIMFTTLVADEMVDRGARRWPTYARAIVAGCAVGALAQWQLYQWLAMRTPVEVLGAPSDVIVMQPVVAFFEYLIWGSIIVFIYVNRRTELRAAARMSAAQLDRAQTQRRTLESQLQALQARVEPRFLFNALAQVRDSYDERPALGRQMLDDLIVYLRAALPHLRDSTSTLEKELTLLTAYESVLRAHHGKRPDFHFDAAASVLAARVPAMLLLPLFDQILAGAPPTTVAGAPVHLSARAADGLLRIEISGPRGHLPPRCDEVLRDVRQRLAALYGERATLAVVPVDGTAIRLEIEIPHETPDGGHC